MLEFTINFFLHYLNLGPTMAMTPDIAEVTTQQWVLLFLLAVLTWFSAVVTYRLYLGPLAKFPGPRLAALTGWYETYFECYKRGRYWVEIEKMHEKYGNLPGRTNFGFNFCSTIYLRLREVEAHMIYRSNRPYFAMGNSH